MDGASVFAQEMALRMARHPQAQQVLSPVNELALKLPCAHPQKLGHPGQIALRDVDKALLLTAVGATGLALEP
jgi:hypothetical protein